MQESFPAFGELVILCMVRMAFPDVSGCVNDSQFRMRQQNLLGVVIETAKNLADSKLGA
jgi:hypothetical protein